jgi:hypothetical protein
MKEKRKEWQEKKNHIQIRILIEKCILWMIQYFQFYMISSELLYTNTSLFKHELQILYHPIQTNQYLKKNKKNIQLIKRFIFLHNEIIDLQQHYKSISILIYNLFSIPHHLLLPLNLSIFHNISFYQNEIEFKEKKRWFGKWMCMSNFTE